MTGRRCSGLALDLGQHLGPRGGPLDEVARVLHVQPVAVGDVDELVVAHAALVGEERELRVALLAALADDLRVVVNVGAEALLGAVVHVDVDLHERFVHRRLLHVSSLRRASSHGSISSTSCSEGAIGRTERMSARTKSSEQWVSSRAPVTCGAFIGLTVELMYTWTCCSSRGGA
eukprot:scaffold53522_cov59-Phaeocystis_antarctica.AAC.1